MGKEKSKINKSKIFFIDFDGTLVDSCEAHLKSFNEIFLNNNLPPIYYYKFIKIFGLRTEKIIKKLFPKLNNNKIKKLRNEKKKIFLEKYYKLVKIFPNVNSTLRKLRKDYFLILFTNSSREEIKKIAKYTKLRLDYFDMIIKKEEINKIKNKIKNIEKFIVGDSFVDILYAKKIKAKSIIVINKDNKKILDEIKKYRPNYIIKNFYDILKIVKF
ncbi:MAG: HAD hydrolase-like protein [Candidatus Pacearchaeota archaeon]